MIKKIRIESFRCIKDLEMDLEPLTVLVGPNASGKSTVLAALALRQWRPSDGTGSISWHESEGTRKGKHGPATQVVLATQSAELLDHVQPREVRFLERDAEGGVQVRTAPVDDEAWANAIHEYENSVGQMWLSGSLGGVPGAQ